MGTNITVTVHSIAEDGLPDMDTLTGRVALIFDGCVVSGWPLRAFADGGERLWEGNSDVSHLRPFGGVTHWIEFPVPVWEIASLGGGSSSAPGIDTITLANGEQPRIAGGS